MRREHAPRGAWETLLGGVMTRKQLATLSDADWDHIEKRAVEVFAAIDRIKAGIAEHEASRAGTASPRSSGGHGSG